jgi:hypothetical protein
MSFILNRYFLVSGSKNDYLKKLSKISLKLYLFIIISFSILINIYIIFEYSVDKYVSFKSHEKSQIANPFDKFSPQQIATRRQNTQSNF